MKIFLVRHGRSKGNEDKSEYFRKLDSEIELTDLGKEQAKGAALEIMRLCSSEYKLEHFTGNVIYSPYVRAKQTADIIIDTLESYVENTITLVKSSPTLRERQWGNLRDIVNSGQKTEGHFKFFYTPDGGESFAQCYDRVSIFHQWLITNHSDRNNIVVAHGEFNKLYCMHLMGWSLEEFDKWKTPRNGQVLLFEDGKLSGETPLLLKRN